MSIDLNLRVSARDVAMDCSWPSKSTVALLGGNGAGKSTVLQLLAGLLQPDQGRIVVNGRTLASVAVPGHQDVRIPPHRRDVALLAQQPLLFPHLTVAENVAFGPRSKGRSRAESRESAARWLAVVDAGEFADRRPQQLSGGQAQRVALARALAAEPDLLLLDEPLAALDVATAADIRQTLHRVLAGRSAIVVTHQVLDAVLLADRIVVLDAGRIVESGDADTVTQRPQSAFAARFCGLNLVRGSAVDIESIRSPDGSVVVGQSEAPLRPGEPAVAVFPPVAVSVHTELPSGSPRNVFPSVVTAVEPQAHLVRVRTEHLSADITPGSVARLGVRVGAAVHLVVKAAEVRLYPAD